MVIDCAHYTAILWFEIKIFAHLKGFIIIYKSFNFEIYKIEALNNFNLLF